MSWMLLDHPPDRVAVAVDGAALSYGELAARAAATRPDRVLVARSDIDTVVAIAAHIAAATPFVLVHHALSNVERDALIARGREVCLGGDDAVALFTSGTTGRPHAVVLGRRALIASARAHIAALHLRPSDRWLCALPLAHVAGLSILLRTWMAGATAVVAPRFRAAETARAIAAGEISFVSLVPTMLGDLLDAGVERGALRCVLVGGARTPPALRERARRTDLPLRFTYGMTETASGVILDGVPMAGVETALRDGRLWLRGPTIAGGWLDTGDLADIDPDTGHVRVLGRAGDTIISGGENVDPAEVEDALGGVPGVRGACVFGVDDERLGQIVAAVIAASPDAAQRALVDVADRLAPFKRPRLACTVDELPRGTTGKLDRATAHDRYRSALKPVARR